jgi:hypothetical protein
MNRFHRALVLLFLLGVPLSQHQSGLAEQSGAKVWVGRYQEIEDYLRTAECVSVTTFGPNRATRCNLPPGGPVARMAWRTLPPGVYRGFRESYKAEIAAYEMDKLLKLDMVPPTVERQVDGNTGAAQVWVEGLIGLKNGESPEDAARDNWENQLARMAMFDALIGFRDRNLGNTLRDASWQLILLDHSRAFTANSELPRKVTTIDRAFWQRIESLTRTQLDAALTRWLDEDEIAAILERRERMRAEIKSGVKP